MTALSVPLALCNEHRVKYTAGTRDSLPARQQFMLEEVLQTNYARLEKTLQRHSRTSLIIAGVISVEHSVPITV